MNLFTVQRCEISTITVAAENEEEAIEIAGAANFGWEFEDDKLRVIDIRDEL